jgi:hypothetical protein
MRESGDIPNKDIIMVGWGLGNVISLQEQGVQETL